MLITMNIHDEKGVNQIASGPVRVRISGAAAEMPDDVDMLRKAPSSMPDTQGNEANTNASSNNELTVPATEAESALAGAEERILLGGERSLPPPANEISKRFNNERFCATRRASLWRIIVPVVAMS